MATLVIMPRQGQSVESCVITEWKKKKGDAVAVKDILFSYETDKSSFDEEAAVAGTLLETFAEDGDDVPCLNPVCIIGEPGEDISALVAEAKRQIGGDEPEPEVKPEPAASTPAALRQLRQRHLPLPHPETALYVSRPEHVILRSAPARISQRRSRPVRWAE